VSLGGSRVYVAIRGEGSLVVMDPRTGQVTSCIEVGQDPVAIAITITHGRPVPDSTPAPTSVPAAHPTAPPRIVPKARPLPEGVLPPEHMPTGALSGPFVPSAAYPVTFAFAPDGTLFYNELHSGNVRIVKNGQVLPEAFYNFKVSGQPEAGLIGLTLDPDFSTNH
jgi:YVTN family beta-propeller protein